ncbi:22955_t:CDS:2 [Cetraspora pellucida]|uniref:22955_t:CDS:1 n=1 Tax=Cetraspora pellucida TaxID=1433469 RepID=A0A9N8ZP04_9GLOM|nr:22955_t:CDS:2 [Cetraspora pellucida]
MIPFKLSFYPARRLIKSNVIKVVDSVEKGKKVIVGDVKMCGSVEKSLSKKQLLRKRNDICSRIYTY